MKRKGISFLTALCLSALVCGCGAETDAGNGNTGAGNTVPDGSGNVSEYGDVDIVQVETAGESTTENNAYEEPEVAPEHSYRSELTNQWIDESLMNQRPIAVMVDNELTALPHFGVNQCDIVYELMNSTENDRITRLMCIMKDWQSITQLGSIRSVRPTNFMLAAEYNAIIIHDGGPFYCDQYYERDYCDHLSGGFARFVNGKATEFTEYVTYEDYTNSKGKSFDGLRDRLASAKIDTEYNEFYDGQHFTFSNTEFTLSDSYNTISATDIDLPFWHNSSELFYNEETKTYDYYEYGNPHIDSLDNCVTTFKNVIVQDCTFAQLDVNGYLIYNVIGSGEGYYITNGEAIEITWEKKHTETAITRFYNKATGEEIQLNTGKTYITIIPSDTWGELVIK